MVRRERQKNNSSKVSATRLERETPTEPDLNPTRRLNMTSASLAASSCEQHHVQSSTEVEAATPTEAPMEVDADEQSCFAQLPDTRRSVAERHLQWKLSQAVPQSHSPLMKELTVLVTKKSTKEYRERRAS